MYDIAKHSGDYFKSGFNCSESVLSAVADHYGIESELIPRIATGLGAGMGKSSGVCGALSGGILALNMLFGRDAVDQADAKTQTYKKVNPLVRTLKEKFGTTLCTDLLGFNLGEEGADERFDAEGMFDKVCKPVTEAAAQMVVDIAGDKE